MDSIPHLIGVASAFIAVASLKGTVLIVLVLAAQKLLGTLLPAKLRYLLWFTAIVGLVTPVGFEAALLPQAQPPPSTKFALQPSMTLPTVEPYSLAGADTAQPFSPPATSTDAETSGAAETLPRSSLALLPYLWLAGVFAVFGAIALSGYRFARLARGAQPASEDLHDFLRECMQLTACTRIIAVRQSEHVAAPMIAGQFRPVLLLPAGLERQLTRAQLRHVFIHELMHLQRGDILSNWIVAVVQALHWFNPAVWFAFFRMRQDRELACDAATLRHLAPADRAAYGHTLLRLNDTLLQARVPALALGMLEPRSPLHLRILMLTRASQRSVRGNLLALLAALPLAAVAFSQPVSVSSAELTLEAAPPAAVASVASPAPEARVEAAEPLASATPVEEPAERVAEAITAAGSETTDAPEPPAAVAPTRVAATSVPLDPPQPAPTPPAQRVLAAADSFSPPAAAEVMAAVSSPWATPPASEAGTALMADIEELAAAIAEAREDSLAFIEKWEAIGTECDAREGRFLGALSASCQRIRTAQRRGEIFRFAFACYQLNAWQEQQALAYGAASPRRDVDAALRANAEQLATFCGKETYAERYPAFATMIADAEALKYYPRRMSNAEKTYLAIYEARGAAYRMQGVANASLDGLQTTQTNYWPMGYATEQLTGVPVPPGGFGPDFVGVGQPDPAAAPAPAP